MFLSHPPLFVLRWRGEGKPEERVPVYKYREKFYFDQKDAEAAAQQAFRDDVKRFMRAEWVGCLRGFLMQPLSRDKARTHTSKAGMLYIDQCGYHKRLYLSRLWKDERALALARYTDGDPLVSAYFEKRCTCQVLQNPVPLGEIVLEDIDETQPIYYADAIGHDIFLCENKEIARAAFLREHQPELVGELKESVCEKLFLAYEDTDREEWRVSQ